MSQVYPKASFPRITSFPFDDRWGFGPNSHSGFLTHVCCGQNVVNKSSQSPDPSSHLSAVLGHNPSADPEKIGVLSCSYFIIMKYFLDVYAFSWYSLSVPYEQNTELKMYTRFLFSRTWWLSGRDLHRTRNYTYTHNFPLCKVLRRVKGK